MAATGPDATAQLYRPAAYPAWKDTATQTPACRGTDLTLWFAGKQGRRLDTARAICHRCPLLDTCRDWALAQSPRWLHGVWGGLTQYEREAILRARRDAEALEAA